MTKRIFVLVLLFAVMSSTSSLNAASPKADRKYWVNTMLRIATPVYENLANETLRENMPVEVNDGSNTGKRANVSHLEALGRSFNGIAPWLNLSEDIAPAQVRCALTAVIKRQTVKDMFDKEGWLTLGFCGHQPDVAENYVSTGSAYLCCFVFLPLVLPADAEFWSAGDEKWSSQRVWSGEDVMRDAAVNY